MLNENNHLYGELRKMLSKKELDELCMKGEYLLQRLCAVDNGRIIHEARNIGNLLCNYVPNLRDGYAALSEIEAGKESGWTEEKAKDFCNRVEMHLRESIDRAIKFLNANNI